MLDVWGYKGSMFKRPIVWEDLDKLKQSPRATFEGLSPDQQRKCFADLLEGKSDPLSQWVVLDGAVVDRMEVLLAVVEHYVREMNGEGRIKTFGFLLNRSIRVLSPRMEPPVRVDDGSTASTATR